MKVNIRKNNRIRRKLRIRKKVYGTAERPRLTVFRSLKYTYAQLINDLTGETLVGTGDKVKALHKDKTKQEAALEVGKLLAERAKKKGIKEAIFDRNGYKYHGRIKNLAEGAREAGLKL